MPWGIVAGPGAVDDHQFSASPTSLTVGGPDRQRSTTPGKSLHHHVSVKGFVKSPQRGCTEWNWKTCCLYLYLYLCPCYFFVFSALLLFTCLFAYNVTEIKIPENPSYSYRRSRAYVYTSAFENGITIVRGIAVRVARGGYPTSPPTIGKHNLFGVTRPFGTRGYDRRTEPYRKLPISNTMRPFTVHSPSPFSLVSE